MQDHSPGYFITTIDPISLTPHPMSSEIYRDGVTPDLLESIREHGILTPITVTFDNRILSGHRRWEAAMQLKLETVQIITYHTNDELELEQVILESNKYRTKDNEQIGREYSHSSRIVNERASRQGHRTDYDDLTSVFQATEVAPPSTQAADMIGVSKAHATKAAAVVKVIDKLKKEGKTAKAKSLTDELNKSARTAFDRIRAEGYVPQAKPRKPQAKGKLPQSTGSPYVTDIPVLTIDQQKDQAIRGTVNFVPPEPVKPAEKVAVQPPEEKQVVEFLFTPDCTGCRAWIPDADTDRFRCMELGSFHQYKTGVMPCKGARYAEPVDGYEWVCRYERKP